MSEPPLRLVLATSIPPSLRGQPFTAEIEDSLQQRTLRSWYQQGFSLVSLHSAAELANCTSHAEQLLQAGLQPLVLDQNVPDRLPNLSASLLALVNGHTNTLLAITNADIMFADGQALSKALHNLQPQQALVGRRSNVPAEFDATASIQGNRDGYGFDFFAFHATALRQALPLIPESLVFGRPWWDLFLPLALLASGLELIDSGPDLFLHPNHEERWSAEQWYRHGQAADQRFLELLQRHGRQEFARRWMRQRRRYIRRWPGLTGLRHRLREQRRSLLSDGRLLPLHLSDVSDAINDLVDRELTTSAPA